jgi:ABC-type transport system substrate-binding protein
LDDSWQNPELPLPCADLTGEARQAEAVRLLKEAGYSWNREPGPDTAGSSLMHPGEFLLPSFRLLAPEQDRMREITAKYIAQQAEILGLSVKIQLIKSDDLLYAVYGSQDYDMALLGWRLSAYPSYLCDWFMPWGQNPFTYSGDNLQSACEAWTQSTDLDTAKTHAYEVQSVLAHDLPLIPLYSGVRFDAYRNIRYPFTDVVDGLGGLYGAPELAIPIP